MHTVTPCIAALTEGLIDYAGLFPPAALDMDAAVAAYRAHAASAEAFMLGRFVVTAARLGELAEALSRACNGTPPSQPWKVSAVAGATDAATISAFNATHGGWAVVDTVEAKAATAEAAEQSIDAFGEGIQLYVELPVTCDLDAVLPLLKARGARAKVRTGGLTPELFPSSEAVASFMAACLRHDVPFKATAGLHHLVRGDHPMNGRPDGERALMHGFFNVFVAAALLADGGLEADARELLDETSFDAFGFDDDTIFWQGHRVYTHSLERARKACAVSFGSCSFDEPCDELRENGLL